MLKYYVNKIKRNTVCNTEWPQKPGFTVGQVSLGSDVRKVELGQVFLPVLCFSMSGIIRSVNTHLFNCQQLHTIFATASTDKYNTFSTLQISNFPIRDVGVNGGCALKYYASLVSAISYSFKFVSNTLVYYETYPCSILCHILFCSASQANFQFLGYKYFQQEQNIFHKHLVYSKVLMKSFYTFVTKQCVIFN